MKCRLKKSSLILLSPILLMNGFISATFLAFADAVCEKIVAGKKVAFTGDSIDGLMIDKRALATLNKKYPRLSITERVFTGTLQTCSECRDNYITCSD